MDADGVKLTSALCSCSELFPRALLLLGVAVVVVVADEAVVVVVVAADDLDVEESGWKRRRRRLSLPGGLCVGELGAEASRMAWLLRMAFNVLRLGEWVEGAECGGW